MLTIMLLIFSDPSDARLIWPIDCIPGQSCTGIGYPDVDNNNIAYNCGSPGYQNHSGTDIGITWQQMDEGTPVFAAANGVVKWVFDGKYDRCPNPMEPDCQVPNGFPPPGQSQGVRVCTPLIQCNNGQCCCYYCFDGGNVVVIDHPEGQVFSATRYDHLRRNSIRVSVGDHVVQGQQIAEAASAGRSTGPHLHFEVWFRGNYELVEPWVGSCGPNTGTVMWRYDPPWASRILAAQYASWPTDDNVLTVVAAITAYSH